MTSKKRIISIISVFLISLLASFIIVDKPFKASDLFFAFCFTFFLVCMIADILLRINVIAFMRSKYPQWIDECRTKLHPDGPHVFLSAEYEGNLISWLEREPYSENCLAEYRKYKNLSLVLRIVPSALFIITIIFI